MSSLPPPPCVAPAVRHKCQRRNATTILAGDFDVRPSRDVLTSVLNRNPYRNVEKLEGKKRRRKEKQKMRELEIQRYRLAPAKVTIKPLPLKATGSGVVAHSSIKESAFTFRPPTERLPTLHIGRPRINIIMPRSISITPPPMSLSPDSTPGPSNSSSTSHTSSKHPHTPLDGEFFTHPELLFTPSPQKPRKKRPAVRKGWKGWVEGSPEPSTKLINLDTAPVIQERRTRNGKTFGAVPESTCV